MAGVFPSTIDSRKTPALMNSHAFRPFLATFLLCSAALAPLGVARTDHDGDGYDDVWQRVHGVTVAAFPLASDADGDGNSNFTESEAGTDLRSATSVLAIGAVTKSGGNLVFSAATVNLKRYQLQSSASPGGPTWTNEGAPVTGDGTVKNFTTPLSGTAKFFRILVQDQDTDGDTVSDWAEALMGTNANLAITPTNASGGVASDGLTLRSLLSITAATTTPSAFEKEGTPAAVRLTRTFGTMPLTLPLSQGGASDPTKGSASPSDFTLTGATPTTVSFANAATTRDVSVNPVLDAAAEVPETLKLTVSLPGVPVTATAPSASVQIKDATVITGNRRLYVAYLGREAGVATTATGIATALVNGDNDQAAISLTFSNLSSVQNTAYIRFTGNSGEVKLVPNGQVSGFPWDIRAAQTLVTDQATLNALASGQLYVSVSSADFSGGEIRGTFALADGSIADPPVPPAPPAYNSAEFPNLAASGVTDNPTLDRDIARFLQQCTYGPTPESIQEVRDLITANGNDMIAGYTAWINRQMDLVQTPSPSLVKLVQAADTEEFIIRGNKPSTDNNDPQFGGNSFVFNATSRTFVASAQHQNNHPFHNNRRREWWTLVLNSRDQLRQRMAMALHEIVVIGENDTSVQTYHYGTANYWDILAANAFGPYRTILQRVTYSPLMGVYLSHLKNEKQTGTISPDENYAREIMQLFAIGLVLRHDNGSLKLDPDTALPIPTYDQEDITELARVMTGLSFSRYHNPTVGAATDSASSDFTRSNGDRWWQSSWTNDLRMFSAFHDFNEYTAYTGLPLPSGVTSASKILFRDKAGQTVIPIRTQSDANGNADITNALNALAGDQGAASYNGHPTTPVFISRLLLQRFTTANPSAGYLYRVTQVYKQTKGNLGDVLKAILLDHEARSLSIADNTATAGKPKEPLLHYAAMLRALKCYTGAPLASLNTMPVTFTTAQSWITTPYDINELNKFPAGAKRFRFGNTDGTLAQSPQDAPSVFNWFLPDYVLPGPIAAAGLVAPEFQVATESNVVNIVNEHYNTLFTTIPPGTTVKPGRSLDDFFNLSQYQTATNGALTVPAYARPFDAGTNPTGVGYFSAATFDSSPGGTENAGTINNQLDNILPDYGDLTTLYTNAYNQRLIEVYAPAAVPSNPGNSFKNQAHDAAALAVLDQCDQLFAAGFLKANFGSLPPTTASPRKSIVDALQASPGIGSRTTHTDAASNGFLINAQSRCRNIAFLVLTSPQALILK
jgi:uncharacterized protein (DUF1800 family)